MWRVVVVVVVVVVVGFAGRRVPRDWYRWKMGVLFWVLGADEGRAWVGFGRRDHFASRGCSIRMRFGTMLFLSKEFRG